jgi:hypothetical protein
VEGSANDAEGMEMTRRSASETDLSIQKKSRNVTSMVVLAWNYGDP